MESTGWAWAMPPIQPCVTFPSHAQPLHHKCLKTLASRCQGQGSKRHPRVSAAGKVDTGKAWLPARTEGRGPGQRWKRLRDPPCQLGSWQFLKKYARHTTSSSFCNVRALLFRIQPSESRGKNKAAACLILWDIFHICMSLHTSLQNILFHNFLALNLPAVQTNHSRIAGKELEVQQRKVRVI